MPWTVLRALIQLSTLSAYVGKQIGETAMCSVGPGLHGAQGNVEPLGDLRLRQVVEERETHDLALVVGQVG